VFDPIHRRRLKEEHMNLPTFSYFQITASLPIVWFLHQERWGDEGTSNRTITYYGHNFEEDPAPAIRFEIWEQLFPIVERKPTISVCSVHLRPRLHPQRGKIDFQANHIEPRRIWRPAAPVTNNFFRTRMNGPMDRISQVLRFGQFSAFVFSQIELWFSLLLL